MPDLRDPEALHSEALDNDPLSPDSAHHNALPQSATAAAEATPAEATRQWLERVVIGLNLCPFAHKPLRRGLIDIVECDATEPVVVLEALHQQLQRLEVTPPQTLETIVMVLSRTLADFGDYNQFLDYVDGLLVQEGWEGTFQVASFHPDYQFAGTDADDQSNLTNRSPWPLLHILREDSLEQALAQYPDSDRIPEANIARVCALTEAQQRALFPYLWR